MPTDTNLASADLALPFSLDPTDLAGLGCYLEALGWARASEIRRAERIGDGNMNLTVRVYTGSGSFVLKQAKPYVVKYPQIAAPVERAAVEAAFYRLTANAGEVSGRMPRLLGFAEDSHLLWLEDLGEAADCMDCYRGAPIGEAGCRELAAFLGNLHGLVLPEEALALVRNRAMRALNHEHQYDLPLRRGNGLDLDRITPGLAGLAGALIGDGEYCRRVGELGERYLRDGMRLLHGDFFPGSWLRTEGGMAVIDAEFCYGGEPEYDLGVFQAHLELAGAGQLWPVVKATYPRAADWRLAGRYAGAELMRRLIGVAQLPLAADLEAKREWLAQSRELLCGQ
jgi:5-methylthioribose kinase